MKTVNAERHEPKRDCWAFGENECQILTTTHCKNSDKCGHYQTEVQRSVSLKKAQARLKALGINVSDKYKVLQTKNNRVSGN